MKTIILSAAAAALALTAPVFAETSTDFALAHFAQSEEGGDGVRRIGDATSTGNVGYVIEHFAQDREGGDGPRPLVHDADGMTVSTSNKNLAAFAAAKLDNDERGDN